MSTRVLTVTQDGRAVVVHSRDPGRILNVGPAGPPGDDAATAEMAYHHEQSLASTVWLIVHNLGFDPAGIVVLDDAGNRHFPGLITYPVPGVQIRLEFLDSLTGTADLS